MGAIRSSFPSLATLWWTLTSALISLDCNNVWRNWSSCSPDNLLSASLSDVSNFDKTAQTEMNEINKRQERENKDIMLNVQWNEMKLG